jgi:hypothetical protein
MTGSGRAVPVAAGRCLAAQLGGQLSGGQVGAAAVSGRPDGGIHLANFAAAKLTIDKFGAIAA